MVVVLLGLITLAVRERRQDYRAERATERSKLTDERWRIDTRGAVPALPAEQSESAGDEPPVARFEGANEVPVPAAAAAAARPDGGTHLSSAGDAGLQSGDAGLATSALAADAGALVADAGVARDAAAGAAADGGLTALAATVTCGPNTCAAGQVCCNESCGICARPGEQCSQQECGVQTLPVSAMCGINTCNVGFVCCNASCGTCVRPGQPCDTTACANEIEYPVSVTCGMSTCNVGMECCNASCGTCVPRGQSCSKESCT